MAAELERRGAGMHDHGGFGRGVVAMSVRRLQAFDRCDVHDCAAATARDHARGGGARHRRRSGDVHAQHLRNVLAAEVDERADGLHCGVVDDRIHRAEGRCDRIADRVGVALDVAADDACAVTQFARDAFGFIVMRVCVDRDARTRGVEAPRDAGADAAARTGDDDASTVEIKEIGDRCFDHDGMNAEALALIEHFKMEPLPVEGTYYTSTYRSKARAADGGDAGSAIVGLYAHEPLSYSCFHRLAFDEVWHVYAGDPFRLILLHPDGTTEDVIMGSDLLAGQRVQYVVPAGTWQAGHLIAGGDFALYGTTMAPAFTPACFEAGTAAMLAPLYPARAADIALYAASGEDLVMPADVL